MTQIVIHVQNNEKARLLLELLRSLDFVDTVETGESSLSQTTTADNDFFALAGIWQEREIDLAKLRRSIWPRQTS